MVNDKKNTAIIKHQYIFLIKFVVFYYMKKN